MIGPAYLAALGACSVGGAVALVWPNRRAATSLAATIVLAGGVGFLIAAAAGLAGAAPWVWRVPAVLRPLDGLALRLDPLAAFFVGLVGLGTVPVAIYTPAYLAGTTTHARWRTSLLALFVAAMALVPAADNGITFLLAWEGMTVTSYLLVVGDLGSTDAHAAGLWYLAMTHAGLLALVVAFVLLGGDGSLAFASLRTAAIRCPPGVRTAVALLALFAFGSKAGLAPLHVWLPRAHPAAPSPVSALMSAVMVKLGVYGLVRFTFDLLPSGPAWYGGTIVLLGLLTGLIGVLYAVVDQHLKRVLAYSTIENMGLVFVGVGFALLMRANGQTALAAGSLATALLHVLNHAVFKTLLFLGAGAMIHAVGTPDLEAYGGLVRRMPVTAPCFLIGCLALAALPPLNGFPSEWLLVQVLAAGARGAVPQLAVLLPLAVACVALTAGLAAVAAVRLFGIACLALPRSAAAAAAHEVGPGMRLATMLPAGAVLLLGLMPAPALAVAKALTGALGLRLEPSVGMTVLAIPEITSRVWPAGILGVMVAGAAAAFLLLRATGFRRAAVRTGEAWGCGRMGQSPRMEYTAASFAEPLKRVFAAFYRPTHEVRIDAHPASEYFVRSMKYEGRLTPWLEQVLYDPLIALLRRLSAEIRRLQAGALHVYLAYVTVALLCLLVASSWVGP